MRNILKTLIESHPDRAITYESFMEAALYHSQYGYYTNGRQKIGKSGDFYTSPHVHPVFGRVFAQVFFNIIRRENLPAVICEFGGGDGRFAQSVLEEWQRLTDPDEQEMTYIIVESSPYQRQQQISHQNLIQYDSFEQLHSDYPTFEGIIFSNELLDAFPVRVVEYRDDHLFEVCVTIDDCGELTETLTDCTDPGIIEWLDTYGFSLTEGQRVEIPLVMTDWLRQTADWLDRGTMITIDYGYTAEEWKSVERKKGSLRGYHHHEMVNNPLLNPGEMDLTAHVHLDAIKQIGEEHGFEHEKTVKQSKYLLEAGILNELIEHQDADPFSAASKQNRAIRSLILDGSISSFFHVMVQNKGMKKDDE